MDKPVKAPARLLMAIATLQGFCLLGLYRVYEHSVWPSDLPVVAVPLWQLCLMLPVLLLLSLDETHRVRAALASAGFTAFCSPFAAFIGWQMMPDGFFRTGPLVFTYCLTMIIVTFKAAMYLQAWARREGFAYETLFTHSWRNFLVMGLALLFVLAVALLLLLWAQLFKVIGVDFFSYLFQRDWFLFPVFGFAFGVGITLFRDLTGVIDSITGLLQGLIRLLLPALVVVTLLFLASLAVVGVGTLWETGFGSTLLLWLTAILLFFINAVYQDGRGDTVYSLGVHRLIAVGVLSLPVLSVLSADGLLTRIGQYGLTVERIYALLVWLVLLLFALGYCWGVLRRRDRWVETLGRVNVAMGLVLVSLLLLLSSPLIDPRQLSVNSQLAMLARGDTTLESLDVRYFRQQLARPGYLAYERLARQHAEAHPGLVERWRLFQSYQPLPQPDNRDVWERIALKPEGLRVPDGVVQLINQTHPSALQGEGILMSADLDQDGRPEYLLIGMQGGYWGYARFFYREGDGWRVGALDVLAPSPERPNNDALVNEALQIEPPRFLNARLGNVLLVPRVRDRSAITAFQSPDMLIGPTGVPAGRPPGRPADSP